MRFSGTCWKLNIMISVHCGSNSPRKSTIRPKMCRLLLLPISSERVVEHLPAQDPTTHWGFQRRLPPLFSSSPARYSLLHRSSHPLTFLSHLVSSFELFIVLTKARVEFLKVKYFSDVYNWIGEQTFILPELKAERHSYGFPVSQIDSRPNSNIFWV